MDTITKISSEAKIKLPSVMPTIALMDRDEFGVTVDVERVVLTESTVIRSVVVVEVVEAIVSSVRRVGTW